MCVFTTVIIATETTINDDDDDDDNADAGERAPANPVDCDALDLVEVVAVEHGRTRPVRFHLIQRLRAEIDVIDGTRLHTHAQVPEDCSRALEK